MVKITSPPPELLGLPFPWNQTDTAIRYEYLLVLDNSKPNVEKTLSILERFLKAASRLSSLELDVPDPDVRDLFESLEPKLTRKIPALQQYSLTLIEQVLRENKVRFITNETLYEFAHNWLCFLTFELTGDAISWCCCKMENCPDPQLVERYLSIVSSYWCSPLPKPIMSWLFRATIKIAGDKALPLLASLPSQMLEKISPPLELLNLPFPWNQTSIEIRREYLEVLDSNYTTVEKALSVLERSLKAASRPSFREIDNFPEQLSSDWQFYYQKIAKKIPEIEEFDLFAIKLVLEDRIEHISPVIIEDTANGWLWYFSCILARDTLAWCKRAMKDCPHAELVDLYLAIASNYWLCPTLAGLNLKSGLVEAAAVIAGDKATPLLEKRAKEIEEAELVLLSQEKKWLIP